MGRLSLSKKLACGDLFRQNAFSLRFQRGGETRRETLLRKASESTAHVAGFGIQLRGLRPSEPP